MMAKAFATRLAALETAHNVKTGDAELPEHVRQFMRIVAYHCGNWQPGERPFDDLARAINLDEIEPLDAWSAILDQAGRLKRETGKSFAELDNDALAALEGWEEMQ